ncbi:MAG: DOMON domain-containing protein [Saprospiraceae bacterium]
MNLIEKNGMQVQWEWEGETFCFQVFAPENGWVAIGLNAKTGLTETNLIMGSVNNKKVIISDRYILKPGNHQTIESLEGKDILMEKKGFENKKGTTIYFEIPTQPNDEFHTNIEKGKKYFMLLAYSREDDFGHHSMMRTKVKAIF